MVSMILKKAIKKSSIKMKRKIFRDKRIGPISAISTKLMDQYFKECFLNVLKLSNIKN